MKQRYLAFGLCILTDFQLPELMETDREPDVVVTRGRVAVAGVEDEDEDRLYEASGKQLVYRLKGVAACVIRCGRLVVVEPAEGASELRLRLFLLTSMMGCLLLQRGILPLHGAGVTFGTSCLVIGGDSGAGKSTLTDAFLKAGEKFLTDDISVVRFGNTQHVWVEPGHPWRKLKPDAMEALGISGSGLERLEDEEDKFLVSAEKKFVRHPVPLRAFIELGCHDGDEVTLERVRGVERLEVLMHNIYRRQVIPYLGLNEYYYRKIAILSRQVEVYRIRRPRKGLTIDRQLELILAELKGQKEYIS